MGNQDIGREFVGGINQAAGALKPRLEPSDLVRKFQRRITGVRLKPVYVPPPIAAVVGLTFIDERLHMRRRRIGLPERLMLPAISNCPSAHRHAPPG